MFFTDGKTLIILHGVISEFAKWIYFTSNILMVEKEEGIVKLLML